MSALIGNHGQYTAAMQDLGSGTQSVASLRDS